ncbi:DUF2339 domain-containing protein [Verrucomicrobiaceae bacterium 5K15]|uniref:DUF2339 domain-containing protein n=1 Tax=Oceaniferula flava TaxID=2800421 RepID=A0AAE2S9E7_9BACT|nr:DUF2339 domain-containing protein [Oceaniferula flavus]MBK1853463.1 DUF2339 domain-containing protein [Oceaniferula flavus]MBM1134768.1 DUF2339 domain-containing protein [Oceaniferula flavus]
MDQDFRDRLDKLVTRQAEMQSQLKRLGRESERMDADIRQVSEALWKEEKASAKNLDQLKKSIADERKQPKLPAPPPLPRKSAALQGAKDDGKKPKRATPSPLKATALAQPSSAQKSVRKPAFNSGEWELNFGKIWLVRIGVLLLLTGLIFLSTYAYKNWLFNAGAGAKVAFFMIISLSLTSLGMWLERKKKRFLHYGRVVASGGLAAGYYTIYASHFTPSLKLIDSTILVGFLLTIWAAMMLAYAVWKRSRVVAVMDIGLAFYGTIVNPAGWLSLFSALLLSAAGIGLMLRFKWIVIGIGTMIAAYIAHAFWLGGYYPQQAQESVRITYLLSYWLLFTVALTLPAAKSLEAKIQRMFCAINNGAAWTLTVFLIPSFTPHAQIGWISLGVGTLWLGLAVVARRGAIWHRSLTSIFAYQGIFIASLGILIEATGYTRFLVFAVEACVLLAGARRFGGSLTRVLSVLMYFCALVTAVPAVTGGAIAPWLSYAALALVSAVYTAMVNHDLAKGASEAEGHHLLSLLPALMTWAILGFGVFDRLPLAVGINAMWLTVTAVMSLFFLLKKPRWIADLATMSVIVAFAGVGSFLYGLGSLPVAGALLPLLGIASFWWMAPALSQAWADLAENKTTDAEVHNGAFEWVFSCLFWLSLTMTVNEQLVSSRWWLLLGGALALVGHGGAELTKRRSFGVPPLLLHIGSILLLVVVGTRESALGWATVALLLAHLAWVDARRNAVARGWLKMGLSFALTVAASVHAFQGFDRPDIALTMLGLGMMFWAWQRKDVIFATTGGLLPLAIACVTAITLHPGQDWMRYLPIGAALGCHALLWLGSEDDVSWKPLRVLLLSAGIGALVIAASFHVHLSFHGAGMAICWALLAMALFCAGLALRCRPYRLIGLFWLAAAVAHVVLIDVLRMETVGRILSFITLGLVLLGLGFLYNRYQETIRKFL